MDKSEAFDRVEALYTWLTLNHDGQTGDRYQALSDLGDSFTPGMGWRESDVEKNNPHYSEISESNWVGEFEVLTDLLSKWDDLD